MTGLYLFFYLLGPVSVYAGETKVGFRTPGDIHADSPPADLSCPKRVRALAGAYKTLDGDLALRAALLLDPTKTQAYVAQAQGYASLSMSVALGLYSGVRAGVREGAREAHARGRESNRVLNRRVTMAIREEIAYREGLRQYIARYVGKKKARAMNLDGRVIAHTSDYIVKEIEQIRRELPRRSGVLQQRLTDDVKTRIINWHNKVSKASGWTRQLMTRYNRRGQPVFAPPLSEAERSRLNREYDRATRRRVLSANARGFKRGMRRGFVAGAGVGLSAGAMLFHCSGALVGPLAAYFEADLEGCSLRPGAADALIILSNRELQKLCGARPQVVQYLSDALYQMDESMKGSASITTLSPVRCDHDHKKAEMTVEVSNGLRFSLTSIKSGSEHYRTKVSFKNRRGTETSFANEFRGNSPIQISEPRNLEHVWGDQRLTSTNLAQSYYVWKGAVPGTSSRKHTLYNAGIGVLLTELLSGFMHQSCQEAAVADGREVSI